MGTFVFIRILGTIERLLAATAKATTNYIVVTATRPTIVVMTSIVQILANVAENIIRTISKSKYNLNFLNLVCHYYFVILKAILHLYIDCFIAFLLFLFDIHSLLSKISK